MKTALLVLSGAMAMSGVAMAAQTVQVPHFQSVELRGGGHVTISRGPAQSVTIVRGSTAYTRIHTDWSQPDRLVIDTCNADCPHEYDLDVAIVTPRIEGVAISGGGHIETAGAFGSQHSITAAVHGGGSIDTRTLDAQDATAAVDGGGEIRLTARHGLTAAINGGGRIRYRGDPSLTEAINGGGSVSKGD